MRTPAKWVSLQIPVDYRAAKCQLFEKAREKVKTAGNNREITEGGNREKQRITAK
jgi:hypothetical protein